MFFSDGTYSKFRYNPDYLVEYKTYQKTITNQDEVCKGLHLFRDIQLIHNNLFVR